MCFVPINTILLIFEPFNFMHLGLVLECYLLAVIPVSFLFGGN